MNIRQSIVALIVFASSVMTLLGQCDVTLGTSIIDNTTGTIEIVIDGAINDDLSNLDQAVCGVELFFEHESIRDISISLESPSGQSVVLIGPATGAGGSTQFTYWGVEFVPCDSLAMPDLPILDDQFTTEDNWGIFGNYSGQYYPQQGCLEDFNTGLVNGIWTLSFSDVIQFDEGKIDSMRLIFCDSTNIYCQECLADGGTLISVDSDFCEGDPDLNLDIELEFENEPPIELYSYNYLIIEAGEVIGISQEPDLSGYSFGSYQLCGISSLTGQTDDILDDVAGTDYEDFLELLGENNYCASMSTNCISINIIEVLDTILIVDTICLGEVLILDGTEYSETGEYVVSFSQAFCDSVSILHLFVIENQATIMADSDAISCLDGDVILDATESIVSPNTVLNWFKVDDELDPIISGDSVITITEPGVYGLSLISDICSDTAYYEIFNETSIPSFAFNTDTLSCYNPTVMIDMTSSLFLETISWTGSVTSSDEDIEVTTSGTYYVQGIALNGCVGNDSIFILDDFDVPDPILLGDTITCALDTAIIFAVLPDSISYDFTWEGPNIVGSSILEDTILVVQDTTYILSLANLNNGCIEEFVYTVLIDTNRTNFSIQSTIIDCDTPTSEVTVSPASDTIDYQWEHLGLGFIGIGDTISVDQDGIYYLIASTTNGCVDTISHTVVLDTISPVIDVDDVTISCLVDSIQLVSNTLESSLTYLWSGPGDFESTEVSPFVSNPGIYLLEAANNSGCLTNVTIDVMAAEGIPDLTFTVSDILDCNLDMVTITPSDTLNLNFEWGPPSVSDNNGHIVNVGISDIYPVIVTDTLTGCNLLYEVYVPGDFDLPIPTIDVPNINCAHPAVTLKTTFTEEIDSLKWTTGFGFSSTEQSPVISQGGDYYITIFGVNGCIFTDTISVIEEIDLPILTIDVPLLDCLNPSVDISFFSESVSDSLFIRLPSGELVSGNNLSVTEPNIYIAIAKSENGCIDSLVMEVIQDTLGPIASLWTNGQINCTESTTTILVDYQEDGLAFDWSGNSIISPLGIDSIVVDTEGTYGVVITDSANCTTTLDIDILTFFDLPVVTSSVDTINCTQATANITLVTPENTALITWDGPIIIDQDVKEFITEEAGSYVATVTADNNCKSLHTITVVADTIYPQVDIMSNGVLDCDTELVTLTGSSDLDGSTYVWSDLNDNIFLDESLEVGFPGLYDLVITAPNTCLVDTFIIVEIDTLRPEITTGVDPIFNCADVEVNLSIETTTNIISYDWDGPLGFGSGLMDPIAIAPGIYTVIVTNDLGCSTSAEVNVIDDTKGPEIMVRDTFVTCDLLAVKLPLDTDADEISYNWVAPGFSSDKQNPETNIPGEYIVYAISDRNECVTKDTVNVTYIDIPPIFDIESDNLNCYQPQTTLVALDVEDDISAIWTDYNFFPLAQDSLLVEMADSFYLIVLGINSCADTTFVSVVADFEQLDVEILLIEPFQCENTDAILELDGIEIEAMEDFTVSWTTFDGNIESGEESFSANISGEGTYFLNVTNKENGCESIDSITLVKEAPSLEQITIEGNDPNCFGAKDGSIAVVAIEGGIGPYQYIVNNQVAQSDSIFTDLASGSYDIQVIDSLGCTIAMSIDLFDGLDFIATAETDTMIIVGDTINLRSVYNIPDEEVAAIIWTAHNSDYSCDDCFDPFVNPLRNTYYTLYATSRYGCQDSSQVLIKVNRNPKIEVANLFAPGSETNGLFYIQQTRGIEMVLSMSIFDKWASRIFLSENTFPGDSSEAWDGTYKGHYVNPGVYVVVAELLLYSGEIVTYAGDITVLR
ncbi:hypothetical protein N9C29_01735 [Saprospiraceae bacterium]|nr:hypothetical protein [Saprospiraceae bacterium]